ncbi:MAG TPA: FMN-binding glutamate synthase family protein, partial [Deltaproteobacteria bacterium]|nr:FMN-binding glutamate synthase family protein [Deltaproteobacteria bacterium]
GEGGICEHHDHGAEIVWQLGTGYFGARTPEGAFSLEILLEKLERHPKIRAIELKLSQGAKPGKGGILPAAKVTREIAAIRGIPVGQTCYSPNHHDAFGNVDELIDFIEQISSASGLPVGIKSAVGKIDFWQELAERTRARGEGPDYIQIDGGEGGTGAAPLTFSDHVSLPFNIGFARIYKIFQHMDALGKIVWVGSGKLGLPDRAVVAFAMGADLIAIAREPMISIGCIQAQKCHTGYCPAGVATHSPWLQAGLNIEDKAERLARYLRQFRKELLSLAHASGYEHPGLFCGDDIEFATGANRFETLSNVLGYQCTPVPFETFDALGPVEARLASK